MNKDKKIIALYKSGKSGPQIVKLVGAGTSISIIYRVLKKNNVSKVPNLVGKQFGRLVIVEYSGLKRGHRYWECQCDCGEITTVSAKHLKSGNTKSCGCLRREMLRKRHLSKNNLMGQRFERLVAIKDKGVVNGKRRWECQCDCGKIKTVFPHNLKSGRVKSCGCLSKESSRKRQLSKGNVLGQRFERLVVIKDKGIVDEERLWECRCDCGKITTVYGRNLKRGLTKSCGCYRINQLSKRNKERSWNDLDPAADFNFTAEQLSKSKKDARHREELK